MSKKIVTDSGITCGSGLLCCGLHLITCKYLEKGGDIMDNFQQVHNMKQKTETVKIEVLELPKKDEERFDSRMLSM